MAEVTHELLVHFRCQIPSCRGSWTIFVPRQQSLDRTTWWCPWCGNHQTVNPSLPASHRLSSADEEKRQRLWLEYLADPADDVWKENQQG